MPVRAADDPLQTRELAIKNNTISFQSARTCVRFLETPTGDVADENSISSLIHPSAALYHTSFRTHTPGHHVWLLRLSGARAAEPYGSYGGGGGSNKPVRAWRRSRNLIKIFAYT